jgi:3-oxoadipate enol-lactonase
MATIGAHEVLARLPAAVSLHQSASLPALRYAVQGLAGGTPVVLSHALGMSLAMWDGLAAHLAPRHAVLRYDHRAQGGSAPVAAPFGIDDLVDDAARLVREWGQGPVVFVGLSMGGLVGQGLAIRHPALVRALVLANTAAVYPPAARDGLLQRAALVRSGGMAPIVESTVERFISAAGRAAQPALAEAVRARLRGADPAGYAASCEAIQGADWLEQLRNVGCPTLVISAAQDPGATPAMGQQIADQIPASRHLLIDGAAHLSVLEQPQAFADAVDGLLAALA